MREQTSVLVLIDPCSQGSSPELSYAPAELEHPSINIPIDPSSQLQNRTIWSFYVPH